MIRYARLDEKRKTYEWLYCSETTAMHSGEPDYPENPVNTWEEFQENFGDSYFLEEGRKSGAVMIIEENGIEIGNTCYDCFHLNPNMAELDIWLNAKEHCSKGYGSKALKDLMNLLNKHFGINKFIIRPSNKNIQAVKGYKNAGFKEVIDLDKTLKEYLKEEYFDDYSAGDYGANGTITLILEL